MQHQFAGRNRTGKAVDQLAAKEAAKDVVIVLGVPFTHLAKVAESVNTDRIGVSAQNCAAEAKASPVKFPLKW